MGGDEERGAAGERHPACEVGPRGTARPVAGIGLEQALADPDLAAPGVAGRLDEVPLPRDQGPTDRELMHASGAVAERQHHALLRIAPQGEARSARGVRLRQHAGAPRFGKGGVEGHLQGEALQTLEDGVVRDDAEGAGVDRLAPAGVLAARSPRQRLVPVSGAGRAACRRTGAARSPHGSGEIPGSQLTMKRMHSPGATLTSSAYPTIFFSIMRKPSLSRCRAPGR